MTTIRELASAIDSHEDDKNTAGQIRILLFPRGVSVIQFDQELELFVRQEVESGHFSSREALLSHAVRLLRRDQEEAVGGILLGLRDAEEGRTQPLSEAVADVRRGDRK